ncbi:MAG: hypothetical protein R3222_05030 [Balneolaceae bacterium]|nr:hypothetical protein [Balneolaceae bacterium]
MNTQHANSGDWSSRVKRKTLHLAYWTAAYLVTMSIGAFGPELIWNYQTTATIAAILLNVLVGFGMIYANIRYLKEQDEMMQKIQLEAMALSLGVGIVAGLAYSLADATNVISGDAEISYLVILISLTYLGSVFIKYRSYK